MRWWGCGRPHREERAVEGERLVLPPFAAHVEPKPGGQAPQCPLHLLQALPKVHLRPQPQGSHLHVRGTTPTPPAKVTGESRSPGTLFFFGV